MSLPTRPKKSTNVDRCELDDHPHYCPDECGNFEPHTQASPISAQPSEEYHCESCKEKFSTYGQAWSHGTQFGHKVGLFHAQPTPAPADECVVYDAPRKCSRGTTGCIIDRHDELTPGAPSRDGREAQIADPREAEIPTLKYPDRCEYCQGCHGDGCVCPCHGPEPTDSEREAEIRQRLENNYVNFGLPKFQMRADIRDLLTTLRSVREERDALQAKFDALENADYVLNVDATWKAAQRKLEAAEARAVEAERRVKELEGK